MPTYQYACTACDERLEAVQSFSDAPLTECPACQGRLRKVFSAVGVVFKGSGFYKNDSRTGGKTADKGAGEAGAGDTGGTGSGSTSSGDPASGGTGSSDKASTAAGGKGAAGSGAAPAAGSKPATASTPAGKSS